MEEEAYEIRTTGKGPTFWESQRRRVECLEFRVDVSAGSLLTHRQSQHRVVQGELGGGGHPPPPTPQGSPYLPGLLTKTPAVDPVPGRYFPEWGVK